MKFFSLLAVLISISAFAQPGAYANEQLTTRANGQANAQAAVSSEVLKSALTSQTHCENFVRFDAQNIYLGFGSHGLKNSGMVEVVPVNSAQSSFQLTTDDGALDGIGQGTELFVLTPSGLEDWDLQSKKRLGIIATSKETVLAKTEQPQAMARYQNKVVIAHGLLGVTIVDLDSKRVTSEIPLIQDRLPLRSTATGVTVIGQKAYVIMDSDWPVGMFKVPFRGVVVIDMQSEKVVAELDGLNPGADAVAGFGNELLVSLDGGAVFWKYDVSQFRAKKLPQPQARLWQFPSIGHPTGLGVLDDKYYFSCVATDAGHVPSALERTQWGF